MATRLFVRNLKSSSLLTGRLISEISVTGGLDHRSKPNLSLNRFDSTASLRAISDDASMFICSGVKQDEGTGLLQAMLINV